MFLVSDVFLNNSAFPNYPKQGAVLDLDDWHHQYYIDDNLAEYFYVDYEYMIEYEKSGKHTLYFCNWTEVTNIENAIQAINRLHVSSPDLYESVLYSKHLQAKGASPLRG